MDTLGGAQQQTTPASGDLECSPYLSRAADRAGRVSVIGFGVDAFILQCGSRRLLALDEAAAHRAYRYLCNLDAAPACRAVEIPPAGQLAARASGHFAAGDA